MENTLQTLFFIVCQDNDNALRLAIPGLRETL